MLIGLANHAGPDRKDAFPSVGTLVRYTDLSERTVRTALDRLEAEGTIRPCDPAVIAAKIKRPDQRPQGITTHGSSCCRAGTSTLSFRSYHRSYHRCAPPHQQARRRHPRCRPRRPPPRMPFHSRGPREPPRRATRRHIQRYPQHGPGRRRQHARQGHERQPPPPHHPAAHAPSNREPEVEAGLST